MAWYGYCEYDGTEVINVQRTEKYVENMPWFKRAYDVDVLDQIFDTSYSTPMTDEAPWTDPDRMDSYDFWGVYPLSVEGIENSTRESNVIQHIRDGGSPGRLRHGTRSVVFNTVLMGATECAVEYGFNWLKSALLGAPCRPNGTTRCHGSSLTYFSCEPFIDESYPGPCADGACIDPVYAVLDGGRQNTAPDQQKVSDTFTRGDSDTLGLAETGQTWVYSTYGTGATPGFAVENEKAKVRVPGLGSNYSFATIDAGTADVVMEDRIAETSSDLFSGVTFRRDPTVSNSGFVADRRNVYKGTTFSTVVGSNFTSDFQTGDRRRIFVSGSNIRIDRQVGGAGNWTTVFTATDSDYLTKTHFGLAGWSDEAAPARWDDFRIMHDTPGYVTVDGGTPTTVFTATFDGGTPTTVFPIELEEPLPAPFVPNVAPPDTDPTGCQAQMLRSLNDVQFNQGPEITKKKILTDGSCIWTVQFTAVGGDPFEYGKEKVVVEGFLGGEETDPFGPGVDGPFNKIGFNFLDAGCPPISWSGIYDPLCPALVAPPAPVDITAGCFEPRTEWWRRYFTIPKEFVPLWGHSVPLMGITAQFEDLRQVRIRFYPNENDAGIDFIDECNPAADLLVSYVPQDNKLVIDGVSQQVYVEDQDGVQRRADSLVFTSEGLPLVWPELACGYGYIVTIDTVEGTDFPEIDLSVVAKVT